MDKKQITGPGKILLVIVLTFVLLGTAKAVSDCCSSHPYGGCDDESCESMICLDYSSLCCSEIWDEDCASTAASWCAIDCSSSCEDQENCGDCMDFGGCYWYAYYDEELEGTAYTCEEYEGGCISDGYPCDDDYPACYDSDCEINTCEAELSCGDYENCGDCIDSGCAWASTGHGSGECFEEYETMCLDYSTIYTVICGYNACGSSCGDYENCGDCIDEGCIWGTDGVGGECFEDDYSEMCDDYSAVYIDECGIDFCSCMDGIQNNGETDIDCGYASGCGDCDFGQNCVYDSDCNSGYCGDGDACAEDDRVSDVNTFDIDVSNLPSGFELFGSSVSGSIFSSKYDTFIRNSDTGRAYILINSGDVTSANTWDLAGLVVHEQTFNDRRIVSVESFSHMGTEIYNKDLLIYAGDAPYAYCCPSATTAATVYIGCSGMTTTTTKINVSGEDYFVCKDMSGSGAGIPIFGGYGLSVQGLVNGTIEGNVFDYNRNTSMALEDVNDTLILNNNITNTLENAIYFVETCYNNVLMNNYIFNSSEWDFISNASYFNAISDLTTNDTVSSFTYSGDIKIKYSTLPSALPSEYTGLGEYLNVTNDSEAWVEINITYDDAATLDESNIVMMRYNGSEWNEVLGSGANATENYAHANISEFSVFGPAEDVSTVSSCRNLTQANLIYTLTQNLTGNQSHGVCIDIQADNITLDCDSYSITGNILALTYGVYVAGFNNTTIKNCNISSYTEAIYVINSKNDNVFNNRLDYNRGDSLVLDHSSDNMITNNTADYAGSYGIYLSASQNNVLADNTASYHSSGGIAAISSSNNNYINNTVNFNSGDGIYITQSANSTLVNNTVNSNTGMGIYVDTSIVGYADNNTVFNNTAYNNSYGFTFAGSNRNNITQNTALDSKYYGLYFSSASNNTVTNMNSTNNSYSDFYSITSVNNTLINFTTNDTTSSLTYSGTIWLRSATAPAGTDPAGYTNISHYFNATNGSAGAWIYINISYTADDVSGVVDNSTLRIWKNSSGTWNQNINFTGALVSGVDTTAQYIYANISSFGSIFAPMGSNNNIPTMSVITVNTTNVTYTEALLITTVDASDLDSDALGLECGFSNGATDACTGSYGTPQRTCVITWPYDDNINHTVYCRVNDSYSVSTPDVEFNISTYSPVFAITLVSPTNTSYNETSIWTNATTNKDAHTCFVSIDETTNATMDNTTSAFWYNITTGLSEGLHNSSVWCNKSGPGIENDSAIVYFAVDLTEPVVVITSPANDSLHTSSTITVRGYSNEDVSQCSIETDGTSNATMTNSSGDWNAAVSGLADGQHTMIMYCKDIAGNWNNSETLYVTVAVSEEETPSTGGRGGGGTGLRPNITVIEVKDKEGFFVYMDDLISGYKYIFPYSWPTDLRITAMRFDIPIEEKTFDVRVKDRTSASAPTGNVYSYFEVIQTEVPFEDVPEMSFAFHVRIDWIEETGADVNNVKLYAYDGIVWNELESYVDASNGTYIYYNATDNGFHSIYAIAESGAAERIPFIDVLYAIDNYYKAEIGFLDVIQVISDYYTSRI